MAAKTTLGYSKTYGWLLAGSITDSHVLMWLSEGIHATIPPWRVPPRCIGLGWIIDEADLGLLKGLLREEFVDCEFLNNRPTVTVNAAEDRVRKLLTLLGVNTNTKSPMVVARELSSTGELHKRWRKQAALLQVEANCGSSARAAELNSLYTEVKKILSST